MLSLGFHSFLFQLMVLIEFVICHLDNPFNNDIDDDGDDKEAADQKAEKAAKVEKLPDHVHQVAGHAILLRARTGTDGECRLGTRNA